MLGVHGDMVAMTPLMPILMAGYAENLQAFQAGKPLPHILGLAFLLLYTQIGGAGNYLGLAFIMAFRAKSKRYRALGKIAFPPAIFGIQEPLHFGMPAVMNPIMAVPFILAPTLSIIVAYFATSIGLAAVPTLSIAFCPFGIAGLLCGGISCLILSIVVLLMSTAIYYPFFRVMDKIAVQEEEKLELEKENDSATAPSV